MRRISFTGCLLLLMSFYQGVLAQTCKSYISDERFEKYLSKDTLDIKFVGNGNIQKTFEEGEGLPASTGIGVVVNKYFPNLKDRTFLGFYKVELSANINVASTVDTIVASSFTELNGQRLALNSNQFGSSVLTPLNSGQAVNLDMHLYNRCTWWNVISGVKIQYAGSNRNWQIANNGVGADTVRSATLNSLRIGVFHDIINFEYRKNYAVRIGLAYAQNSIRGDLGLQRNEEIRKIFLNSDQRTFHGLETSLELRLKNVHASFSYTWFPVADDKEISGLTDSRFVTTIGFTGGFNISL